jgi:hypothetical protein
VIGSDVKLMVDSNQALGASEAVRRIKPIERLVSYGVDGAAAAEIGTAMARSQVYA